MGYLSEEEEYEKMLLSLELGEFHMFFRGGGLYRLIKSQQHQRIKEPLLHMKRLLKGLK